MNKDQTLVEAPKMLFQYVHTQTCICWLEPNADGRGYVTYMLTVEKPTKRHWLPEQALLYRFNFDTMCYEGIVDDARTTKAIENFGSMIEYIE